MITSTIPSSPELRTEALESLLLEKGWITSEAIDRIVERYEREIGPMRGAHGGGARVDRSRVQAAACSPTAPRRSPSSGSRGTQVERLEVKENAPGVHNVVVCTLCSCYPWAVLGLPPSLVQGLRLPLPRRARAARACSREMGLDARRRRRGPRVGLERRDPLHGAAGAAGRNRGTAPRSELAALVTRDAMIGVARVSGTRRCTPSPRARALLPIDGPAAPPRSNGELVFAAPWESRLFGMTLALIESGAFAWRDFQDELVASIRAWEAAAAPGAEYRYYERWQEALERLLARRDSARDRARLAEPRASPRGPTARPRLTDHDH